MTDITRWKSPGPVATAFMNSMARRQAIQGPIGSGKTRTVFTKLLFLAVAQKPSTLDGVRKFKACVVHQTYRQLWRATIPSWWKTMPQDQGVWTGAKDGPATHKIEFILPDGSRVEFIIDFVAIGDRSAEDVLRGYEPTVVYLNEADLHHPDVYTYARGRAGRYPDMEEGGPTWYGLLMDFNAPEADSWVEEKIINSASENIEYFCQPGGMDAGAENLHNLTPTYYIDEMEDQEDWYIDRMIHSKLGFSRHGKVVWKEYNDRVHCASHDLLPVKGIPLILGADAGGTPAAVIGQKMPNGQMRWLDEVISPDDDFTGPTVFSSALNEMLKDRYEGFKIASAGADPSAEFGGDEEDLCWLDMVRSETKLSWRPAQTNALSPRFEAVRRPLKKLIDGRDPALLISPRCKILRKGLANGYRFKKRETGGTVTYSPEPEKNKWSHVCEALQYGVMVASSYSEVMGRGADSHIITQSHAITDDTPEGEIHRLVAQMAADEDYV